MPNLYTITIVTKIKVSEKKKGKVIHEVEFRFQVRKRPANKVAYPLVHQIKSYNHVSFLGPKSHTCSKVFREKNPLI